jgi:hypothetical protein
MPHDGMRDLDAPTDQMLAVVQHDQHLLRCEGIDQGVQDGPPRLPGNA